MNDHEEFEEGVRAFATGEGQKRNPYPHSSIEGENWIRGWRAARDHKMVADVFEKDLLPKPPYDDPVNKIVFRSFRFSLDASLWLLAMVGAAGAVATAYNSPFHSSDWFRWVILGCYLIAVWVSSAVIFGRIVQWITAKAASKEIGKAVDLRTVFVAFAVVLLLEHLALTTVEAFAGELGHRDWIFTVNGTKGATEWFSE